MDRHERFLQDKRTTRADDPARRRHQRFRHHARALSERKNLIVLLDNTGSGNLEGLSERIAKDHSQPTVRSAEAVDCVSLEKTIDEKGIDAAVAQYRDLKAKQSDTHDFAEPELNSLGYRLMAANKLKEAVEIFKLNVEAYPQGANTYDSLAEAAMNLNERELAIKKLQEVARTESAEYQRGRDVEKTRKPRGDG